MAIPYMGWLLNADSYDTLHRDDMLGHFKQMYQPSNCTIIVAGKIELQTLKSDYRRF